MRTRALEALWQFEEEAAPAAPLLSELLKDSEPEVRRRAAIALGRMGDGARPAGAALLQACQDPDSGVRLAAISALGEARIEPDRVVPIVARLAEEGDASNRRAALGALKDYGPLARGAIEILIRCARHPDSQVRVQAIEALGEMGPAGADALPELAQSIATGGPGTLAAAEAIWKVARRADLAMPAILSRLLTYDEGGSPEEACDIISEIGPSAREAVPRLITLLACEDYDTLWAVVDALAAIGPDAADAIPDLIRRLEHESGLVASGAAAALAKIGRDSIPSLRRTLKEGSPHAREFAVDALGRLGEAAEEAIPDLLSLLGGEGKVEDDAWIAVALAEITPNGDREVVEILVTILVEHPNSYLRARVAGAIGKLGAEGKRALAALRKALKDDDPRVVEAARASIASIERR